MRESKSFTQNSKICAQRKAMKNKVDHFTNWPLCREKLLDYFYQPKVVRFLSVIFERGHSEKYSSIQNSSLEIKTREKCQKKRSSY